MRLSRTTTSVFETDTRAGVLRMRLKICFGLAVSKPVSSFASLR